MDSNNSQLNDCKKLIDHYKNQSIKIMDDINKLKEQINKLEIEYNDNKERMGAKNLQLQGMEYQDTVEIRSKIENAEEINQEFNKYQSYIEWSLEKEEKNNELAINKQKQNELIKTRLNYIKSFNFGINGLSCDEKGSLLLNNRPIRSPYFSKGELEIIVAKLHMSINPDMKVRFIDDFEVLDEDNQKLIVDSLLDNGFQVITAEVGKEKNCENSILLSQCNTVDE